MDLRQPLLPHPQAPAARAPRQRPFRYPPIPAPLLLALAAFAGAPWRDTCRQRAASYALSACRLSGRWQGRPSRRSTRPPPSGTASKPVAS